LAFLLPTTLKATVFKFSRPVIELARLAKFAK